MQEVHATLPIGNIIQNRYQVEALLGKGGFGAVYLVRDLRVRSNVFALKEMIDPNPNELTHFTLEADLLKRADHPSLPRVYRVFDDIEHGRAYMLMDYIEGSNLEQLRKQQPQKRFPLPQALALIGPIVEAISYLHAQQPPIIHRDIKPSNIIVQKSGERTMLVDLGIAKEFDMDATTSAIRHASPGYGAPEQYTRGTNPRTDIYGLGATLYALLTGSIPVEAFYRLTQKAAKRVDPLIPANQLVPGIPEHVAQAIQRAMALENDERFATINDFWQALTARPETFAPANLLSITVPQFPTLVAHNRPVSTPASVVYRPTARRKRGKMLLIPLMALLLISVTAFALILGPFRPTSTSSVTPISTVGQHPISTATRTRPTATPSPTSIPTPTPVSSGIPALVSTYNGSIHDNNGNIDTSMSLNSINQQKEQIQGNFVVDPPLAGNGPFTGTVNANKRIQFTVPGQYGNAPLFFQGKVNRDGSMNGTYCSLDRTTNQCNPNVGGYGNWSVQPSATGSSSIFSF